MIKKTYIYLLLVGLFVGSCAFASETSKEAEIQPKKSYVSLSFSFDGNVTKELLARNDDAMAAIYKLVAKHGIELPRKLQNNLSISQYYEGSSYSKVPTKKIVLYSSVAFNFTKPNFDINALILDFDSLNYTNLHYDLSE